MTNDTDPAGVRTFTETVNDAEFGGRTYEYRSDAFDIRIVENEHTDWPQTVALLRKLANWIAATHKWSGRGDPWAHGPDEPPF